MSIYAYTPGPTHVTQKNWVFPRAIGSFTNAALIHRLTSDGSTSELFWFAGYRRPAMHGLIEKMHPIHPRIMFPTKMGIN